MSSQTAISVADIARELGLTPLAPARPEATVSGAIIADLLSYVMASGQAGQVWVTVQGHANVVAVAALAGLPAIVIAAGFQPEEETKERAQEEGIGLYLSDATAFSLAGRLYELGLR
ncbi:MAG: hypothetical protein ACYC63_14090 [Armatimonadota bacterium]